MEFGPAFDDGGPAEAACSRYIERRPAGRFEHVLKERCRYSDTGSLTRIGRASVVRSLDRPPRQPRELPAFESRFHRPDQAVVIATDEGRSSCLAVGCHLLRCRCGGSFMAEKTRAQIDGLIDIRSFPGRSVTRRASS